MVRVTRNYLSEAPLDPMVSAAISASFSDAWADPRKITSGKAATYLNQSLQSIAYNLGLAPHQIHVLGEPGLAHFYAIQGLLQPSDHFGYLATDRQSVHAIARAHENSGGRSTEIAVDLSGRAVSYPNDLDVLSVNLGNIETGVTADLSALPQGVSRVCDASTSGLFVPLPEEWDCAIFDSASWGGPRGISILAIANEKRWRNPLPHLDNSNLPDTYSVPLLIASAVALEMEVKEIGEQKKLRELTSHLRQRISSEISEVDIAGNLDQSLPHITSASFLMCHGEELVRDLAKQSIHVDSGSACIAADMQPSHVLAAMGVLTHGNIRITLHRGVTLDQIDELVEAIKAAVAKQRP